MTSFDRDALLDFDTAPIMAARAELLALVKDRMAASCVEGTGGYGGSLTVRHPGADEDGIEELRKAARHAGRKLGWRVYTTPGYLLDGVPSVTVTDRREVPDAAADLVEAHNYSRMRSAVDHTERRRRGATDSGPLVVVDPGLTEALDRLLGVIAVEGRRFLHALESDPDDGGPAQAPPAG